MKLAVSLGRRRLLPALALGALGATAAGRLRAVPLTRILVGFPPGGGVDIIARLLARQLEASLGEVVVVENRPGAGGLLAARELLAARPDGHTLLFSNEHTLAIVPHIMAGAGYASPDDFAAVAQVTDKSSIALAVRADSPLHSLRDLSMHAGALSVGVPAPGSVPELVVELLRERYGVAVTAVRYRGGAPLVTDLQAGYVALGLTSLAELLEQARAGRLRVLAVSGPVRHPELADVPTFAEQGFAGLERGGVAGLFAPRGVAPARVEQLQQQVARALESEEVRGQLRLQGSRVNFGDAATLARNMNAIHDAWAERAEAWRARSGAGDPEGRSQPAS
ncbi:tripartite tricarboxylate transporter substrate-binding protein [Achromobacter insolitus]|uniref:tripartite tricarboxylate transporter substrate-binding protein n=1 Tax=Achromobacter insolitus TaxID=217204 RepID=UPI000CEB52F0|nr:tripartite tricarboxylate transporter substrate-binding protein [Achromobacter insolitus]AVG41883.1 tripartite tricarboxylate transporter family receptor 1 [Achromobacter insolitus]AXA74059.1 tripartite tricarboxylate transporter family receptor 1 [Achromobacter insolitus]NGT16497.1 tripartite tricarboxylate transporter family receptor 1 [Achromobacter insolitus]